MDPSNLINTTSNLNRLSHIKRPLKKSGWSKNLDRDLGFKYEICNNQEEVSSCYIYRINKVWTVGALLGFFQIFLSVHKYIIGMIWCAERGDI